MLVVPALWLLALACSSGSSDPELQGDPSKLGGSSSSGASGTLLVGQATVSRILGAPITGIATYYTANGERNCGYDDPADRLYAAARKDNTLWAGSAACGACYKVTGELGSVVVVVNDSCPLSGNGDCGNSGASLDLSPEAFDRVAPRSKGQVSITYQPVSCAVTGTLQYRFKEGSSQYWTAIQIRNAALPVSKLEFNKGGQWVNIPRVDYNYFIATAGVGALGPGGLQLRVTSGDGTQQLTDTLPAILDGQVASGASQFN